MAFLAAAAPYLAAASTVYSVASTLRAGEEAKQAGDIRARELREDATAKQAESQRVAVLARRKGTFAASRARAVAAASGGGIADTTADILIGRVEAQTDLNVLNALYEGDTTARGLRQGAATAQREGRAAKTASRYKAIASALSGASSFADKYGTSTKTFDARAATDDQALYEGLA